MNGKTLSLRAAYEAGRCALRAAGITDASWDAFLLLAHVTGIDRAAFYAYPDRLLPAAENERYEQLIRRRAGRVPLQHLTGRQEFMGYDFVVTPDVLIPRQDTETLVEEGLSVVRDGDRILDMCTGSGCILISLLKMAREERKRTGLTGLGVDVSEPALTVARENNERLLGGAEFAAGNLFEPVTGRFRLIVSNPPYIPTAVIDTLSAEVGQHDPRLALDGREDGLHFYRRIIAGSPEYLADGGHLMLEIGADQAADVSALLEQAGFTEIMVKRDLAGLPRVVRGIWRKDDV